MLARRPLLEPPSPKQRQVEGLGIHETSVSALTAVSSVCTPLGSMYGTPLTEEKAESTGRGPEETRDVRRGPPSLA